MAPFATTMELPGVEVVLGTELALLAAAGRVVVVGKANAVASVAC